MEGDCNSGHGWWALERLAGKSVESKTAAGEASIRKKPAGKKMADVRSETDFSGGCARFEKRNPVNQPDKKKGLDGSKVTRKKRQLALEIKSEKCLCLCKILWGGW